jgi:hypothetical protein
LFNQIADKVEEIMTGTPPECIKGSTTVRVAVGLIVGKSLTNTHFPDEQSWEMLDEVQKEAVVHHRPRSKYAKWLKKEQAEIKRIAKSPRDSGHLDFKL